MARLLVFLAILACFCQAICAEYSTEYTADKDYLLKQKRIYNIVYHLSQPEIVAPELYKEGQAWDIKANIDSYTNSTAVTEFLRHWKNGMLPRGALYSMFYPVLLHETKALFRLFWYAKDFETFYKTALWARAHINEGMFYTAFAQAVIRRPDTKYIRLPAPYEIYPYSFFNSEVLEKAHHPKRFGIMESKGDIETYIIPANYSGWYLNLDSDEEHKLSYFTEDIGLSTYYMYYRFEYPFWLSSEGFDLTTGYRGGEYLYGHKQLWNRYFLERLSNDLGYVEDFDWDREFHTGYFPTMTFHNSFPYPQRSHWSRFPEYKYKYIQKVKDYESRISAAIDSGFLLKEDGKWLNIYTPEGFNYLGNVIEGNKDSLNLPFYGSFDFYTRKILGFNLEPNNPYQIIPSALEYYDTSMRDPAFYRLYKRIFNYWCRYKDHMKAYKNEEVIFPEFKIESVVIDKIQTYFEQYETPIGAGLSVESEKEAESMQIKVRQYRLNHKPFKFHFTVNSEKATKAVMRIFLGPKYDPHHKLYDFRDSYKYFYELDQWILDLNAGMNKIERSSQEFFFTSPDLEPSDIFYKRLTKAIEGEAFKYQGRLYGFPQRLTLPKGKQEGMPFQFFVYICPMASEGFKYSSRIFGDYLLEPKSFGFPLDRPIYEFKFDGPNMFFKDVNIFHKDEYELNVTH